MGEGVHLASSPLGSLLGDGVVMADSWISKVSKAWYVDRLYVHTREHTCT